MTDAEVLEAIKNVCRLWNIDGLSDSDAMYEIDYMLFGHDARHTAECAIFSVSPFRVQRPACDCGATVTSTAVQP